MKQIDSVTSAASKRRQQLRRLDHARDMMIHGDMWVVQRVWEFDNVAERFVLVSVIGYPEDTPGVIMCDLADDM